MAEIPIDALARAQHLLAAGDLTGASAAAQAVLDALQPSTQADLLVWLLAEGILGEALYFADQRDAAGIHFNTMRTLGERLGLTGHVGDPGYREAIATFARRSHLYADILHEHGSELDRAVELRLEAASLLLDTGEEAGAARALRDVSDIERQLGRIDDAERHTKQALAIFESSGDRVMQANCYLSLGDCAEARGSPEAALVNFEKANQLLKDEPDALLDRAHVLAAIGEATDDPADAIDALASARVLFQEHLEDCKRQGAGVDKATLYLGQHSVVEAARSQSTGLYDEARARLAEAVALLDLIDYPMGQGQANLALAHLLFLRGHDSEALRHAGQSAGRFAQISYAPGLIQAQYLLARIAAREGELDRAMALTQRSIDRARKSDLEQLVLAGRLLLVDLLVGAAKLTTGSERDQHLATAQELLAEVQASHRLEEPSARAFLLESQADFARQSGNLVGARALYDAAAAIYATAGSLREAACRHLQAEISAEASDWPACLDYATRAVEALEDRRRRLLGTVIRYEFGRSWDEAYLLAAQAAWNLGRVRQAFEVCALLNGRLVGEEIELRRRGWAAPSVPAEARDTASDMSGFRQRAAALRLVGDPLGDALTRNDRDDAAGYEVAKRRGLATQPLRSPVVAAAEDQVTVAAIAWSDRLHALFVTEPEGEVRVHDFGPVDDPAAEWRRVDQHLAELRLRLDSDHRPATDLLPVLLLAPLDGLRELLWRPLQQLLAAPGRAVRISLPAELAVVPFVRFAQEANIDLTVVPAVGATNSPSAHQRTQRVFAVSANPQHDLPGTLLDMRIAQRDFAAADSIFVEAPEGAARKLLTQEGSFDVLVISSHMAAHGSAHAAGIGLADHEGGSPISTFELLSQMRCTAGVAVLLGCESALPASGPDLLSSASALLAGVRAGAVIATLWPVSDLAAPLVWGLVSRRLANGADPSAALADSLRLLCETRDWRSAERLADDALAGVHVAPPLRARLETYVRHAVESDGRLLLPGDRFCWTVIGG